MKLQTWLTLGAIVLLSAYIGWTSLKLSRLETAYAKLQTELLDTQNKLKQSEEANKLLAATIQSNDNVYSSVQKSLQSSFAQEQQNRLADLSNLHSLYESIAQDEGTNQEDKETATADVSSSQKKEPFTPAPSPFANSPTYIDSKPKAKQAGQTTKTAQNTETNVSSSTNQATTTYNPIVLTEQTNTKVINQLNNAIKEWNSQANLPATKEVSSYVKTN